MRLKFDPNPTSWRGGGGRPPQGPRDRPCPTPRSGGSPATPSPISPLGRCPLWPPGLLRVLASLSHPLSTPRDVSQVAPGAKGTGCAGEGVYPGREAGGRA